MCSPRYIAVLNRKCGFFYRLNNASLTIHFLKEKNHERERTHSLQVYMQLQQQYVNDKCKLSQKA